jgi:hypothetical protein
MGQGMRLALFDVGVGLASGNSFSFGADAGWGMPWAYVPSTTITGPYSYGPALPSHTAQAINPYAFAYDPITGASDFNAPAQQPLYIPETVIPMVEPTFGNFVDWAFGGGN